MMQAPVILEPRGGDIRDASDVAVLVRRFYLAAIPDPLLGPVFRAAELDWGDHIPLLCRFWERELLGSPGYAGNVVRSHTRLLSFVPFGEAHLRRWLDLFEEVVDERFTGPTAELAKRRAIEIAGVVAAACRRHPDFVLAPPDRSNHAHH
jgi:hemoglobin